jgi:hypothetical protein
MFRKTSGALYIYADFRIRDRGVRNTEYSSTALKAPEMEEAIGIGTGIYCRTIGR